MKIALLSDVHLETGTQMPEDKPDADIIVLAGDIAQGLDNHHMAIEEAREKYNLPVVSVYGNHEFYGEKFRPGTVGGYRCMDNYIFISATLWSYPELENVRMLNDFHQIQGMTLDEMRREHLGIRAGMATAIDDAIWYSDKWKVVCVTHHLPSMSCISETYKDNRLNPCFASPTLERIWKPEWEGKLVAWCYGHTHEPADFVEPNTGVRMVCNPHGYFAGTAKWKVFEV